MDYLSLLVGLGLVASGWFLRTIYDAEVPKIRKAFELYDEYERKKKECPHGYESWDDCPDCCH